MPIITDAYFYAVAVPAVLLVGISKSGFGTGFGSLAVPLMALALPVPKVVAILLPLLAVMDVLGLRALWRERDAALLKLLLPAGLVGTLIGWALFSALSATTVAALVGALTLLFLAVQLLRSRHPSHGLQPALVATPTPRRWLGRVLAATSGFTSFVAHAGGPPIGFYVLPLKLAPLQYTATMAVFFAAINAAKWLPYTWLGLIDTGGLLTSLVLAPLAPLGVWLGVRIVKVVPQALFYRLVHTGLALTGAKLLWDGLRAA